MRISSRWLRKEMACGLVMLLAVQYAEAAPAAQQQGTSGQQPQSASSAQSQGDDTASKVGKSDGDASISELAYPENPEPVHSQSTGQSAQPDATQSGSGQPQQDGAQKPVGTAAAPYETTTGVAASRPAGAVIAPAKQRRARSILIRVGVVVGAAVAIGSVVLLSHASPSRPN